MISSTQYIYKVVKEKTGGQLFENNLSSTFTTFHNKNKLY